MYGIDMMGACGPVGCAAPATGQVAPGWGGGAMTPGWGGGVNGWGLAPYGWTYDIQGQGYPVTWDIMGQPAPVMDQVAPQTFGQKVSAFLQSESLGIKHQNWLLGAAAIGGIALAYSAGYLGGGTSTMRRRRRA